MRSKTLFLAAAACARLSAEALSAQRGSRAPLTHTELENFALTGEIAMSRENLFELCRVDNNICFGHLPNPPSLRRSSECVARRVFKFLSTQGELSGREGVVIFKACAEGRAIQPIAVNRQTMFGRHRPRWMSGDENRDLFTKTMAMAPLPGSELSVVSCSVLASEPSDVFKFRTTDAKFNSQYLVFRKIAYEARDRGNIRDCFETPLDFAYKPPK